MAALLVLAVLGVGLLLWQQPWQSDQTAPAVPVPTDAAAILTGQIAELSAATSAAEFARAAGSGPAAAEFAQAAWAARTELAADQVQLRYVSGGGSAEFANGDTLARVEISWPPASGSASGSDATGAVQMRMRPRADGTFDIVSAGLGSGQLPVWLAGAVAVERSDDVTVLRIDGGDDDLAVEEVAAVARRQVVSVVPSTSRQLTVISAPSDEVAAALLGQAPDAVRQIAAVSTSFDERNGTLAGPVVVLNPGVFDTMDERAAQVVMAHEATHVLTGAIGSRADTWVIEGFADFVALHDDTAPLSVSAGQILAQVRADQLPTALPTAEDFNGSAYGLGAVYESAWMVFRMVAEQADDDDVIGFYRSVLDGASVDAAGTAAFGLDTAQITSQWRDYLTKSASTVS